MIILRILTVCMLIAVFNLTALAQESTGVIDQGETYALNDLYRIGLERSEDVKISEDNVVISRENRNLAYADLIPDVNVFSEFTRYSKAETMGETMLQPRWNLAWGMSVGQSFALNGKEFIDVDISDTMVEKSGYDLITVKESYLYDIAAAYFNVLKFAASLDIQKSNVERLEKHRENVVARLELEEVTKTAMFRAEAQLSQAQTNYIRAVNALRLAKAVLARIVGVAEPYEIRKPGEMHETADLEDVDTLIGKALDNRSDVAALKKQMTAAEMNVKSVRSVYWPTVGADAGYTNYDSDPSSEALVEDSYSLALRLSYPIFEGGTKRSKLNTALAEKRQSTLAIDSLAKSVAIEVNEIYLNIITLENILKSMKDQLDYAAQNYEAVSQQFDYGLANSVDVMDANNLLVTSERQLADARYDLELALIKLERIQGTLYRSVMSDVPPS